jgi:hypothetical protein
MNFTSRADQKQRTLRTIIILGTRSRNLELKREKDYNYREERTINKISLQSEN